MVSKEEYWLHKSDNIGSKRKRPIVTPSGEPTMTFVDGHMVAMNRAQRRKSTKNHIGSKKGYSNRLDAIKQKRKKNGKISQKYVLIDRSSV